MLVEHSFVTTLSFHEVYDQGAAFLERLGFQVTTTCWKCNYDLRGTLPQGGTSCPECGSSLWEHTAGGASPRAALLATRGKATASAAGKIDHLPQRLRLEYDRGRCNVAASITEKKKVLPEHREMVMAVANGLEMLLVLGDATTGELEFREAQRMAHEQDQREYKKRQGCLIAFIVVVVLVVMLIIFAVISSKW